MAEGNQLSCSAVELYRKSEERETLLDPDRGNRGPIYAKFMDDFWTNVDKTVASKGKPKTVGDALDLVQSAFVKADEDNAAQLKSIGIKAYLDLYASRNEKQMTAKQLPGGLLSADKGVQDFFAHSAGSFTDLDVKFQKSPNKFALQPVIRSMLGGANVKDPVERIAPVPGLAPSSSHTIDLHSVLDGCKAPSKIPDMEIRPPKAPNPNLEIIRI